MSRQQQILNFATKRKKFYNVAGKGLIRGKNLDGKFKMMTLGTRAAAREKIMEEIVESVYIPEENIKESSEFIDKEENHHDYVERIPTEENISLNTSSANILKGKWAWEFEEED